MTTPEPEIDSLIDALRADLPEREHADRLRAKLIGAGVIVGGGIAAPTTAAGASALNAAANAPAGLFSQAVAWFGGSKIGLAALIVAASAAVPVASYVTSDSKHEVAPRSARANVARRAQTTAAVPGAAEPSSREPAPAPAELAPVAAESRRVKPSVTPAPLERRAESALVSPAPGPAVAAFPAASSQPSEGTLREETELVAKALSALRAGDTVKARGFLAQHARRFPSGMLVRERERALERVEHAEKLGTGGEPE
jgi:hypothetical protein